MDRDELLRRWMSLGSGDGILRARRLARVLTTVSLVLFVLAFLSATYWSLPRLVVLAIALVAGWTIAERNALEGRAAQWPIFKEYIDWDRVKSDLSRHGAPRP